MTVPRSNRRSKSRPTSMASVMSVICISSKQRSVALSATASATGRTGSVTPLARAAAMPRWISCMKAWKWTRRLGATGAVSKNRSISIDLPRPTPP